MEPRKQRTQHRREARSTMLTVKGSPRTAVPHPTQQPAQNGARTVGYGGMWAIKSGKTDHR